MHVTSSGDRQDGPILWLTESTADQHMEIIEAAGTVHYELPYLAARPAELSISALLCCGKVRWRQRVRLAKEAREITDA